MKYFSTFLIVCILAMTVKAQNIKELYNVNVTSVDALIGTWIDINPNHKTNDSYSNTNTLKIGKDSNFRFRDFNHNLDRYEVLTGYITINKGKQIIFNYDDRTKQTFYILYDPYKLKENLSRYMIMGGRNHEFIKVK